MTRIRDMVSILHTHARGEELLLIRIILKKGVSSTRARVKEGFVQDMLHRAYRPRGCFLKHGFSGKPCSRV